MNDEDLNHELHVVCGGFRLPRSAAEDNACAELAKRLLEQCATVGEWEAEWAKAEMDVMYAELSAPPEEPPPSYPRNQPRNAVEKFFMDAMMYLGLMPAEIIAFVEQNYGLWPLHGSPTKAELDKLYAALARSKGLSDERS